MAKKRKTRKSKLNPKRPNQASISLVKAQIEEELTRIQDLHDSMHEDFTDPRTGKTYSRPRKLPVEWTEWIESSGLSSETIYAELGALKPGELKLLAKRYFICTPLGQIQKAEEYIYQLEKSLSACGQKLVQLERLEERVRLATSTLSEASILMNTEWVDRAITDVINATLEQLKAVS